MIKVLLTDDHELVRRGIKGLLNETGDIEVVAEACDGLQALSEYKKHMPDVCILDISMPLMDGVEVTKQLLKNYPDAKILMLTMYTEEQYAVRLLKAGALGYITKATQPEELYRAVRMVAQQQRYLSEEGQGSILGQLLDSTARSSPVQSLSDRELQVLKMIAKGIKTQEIARTLKLSVKTIETYRSRLMSKLHLKNNAVMVLFAHENGLV
jgi:two-component system, NarL family, invasion response regulator UvrY